MKNNELVLKYTDSIKNSCYYLAIGILGISLYLLFQQKIPYFINFISKIGIAIVLMYAVYIILIGTYPIFTDLRMELFEIKNIYVQRIILQNIVLILAIIALIYVFLLQ